MSQSNEGRRVFRGIALSVLLAIAIVTIVLLVSGTIVALRLAGNANWVYDAITLPTIASYLIGITQLLYIVPLIVFFWRQRRFALMKGVVIGAIVVALVNFALVSRDCFPFGSQCR